MVENFEKELMEGEKNIDEKALIKLRELQSEIDETENRPYEYLLSTDDGKIILSHDENNILEACVKLSDEEKALNLIKKTIELRRL